MKNATVAVVDDNLDFSNYLVEFLNCRGYDAKAFNDPCAFLRNVEKINPTVLITDYHMPEMTGLELLSRLKSVPVHLKSIMISGAMNHQMVQSANSLGCDTVLPKPFELNDLMREIDRLTGSN